MKYQDTDLLDVAWDPDPDEYRTGSIPRVFQLIEQVARKLRNVQRRTVRTSGLTPPQYVVLGALGERDRRPLKELADEAQCTPATITGIVDVLERKALVIRQPNPDDRRSMLVALTESGRNLQESTPSLEEMLHGCCTGLGPGDAAQLIALLERLDQSLGSWQARP